MDGRGVGEGHEPRFEFLVQPEDVEPVGRVDDPADLAFLHGER